MNAPANATATKTSRQYSHPNWSRLPEFIDRAMPDDVGINLATGKFQYDATQEEMDQLEDGAMGIGTSFALGISAIGKLMVYSDAKELSESDWRSLGDLLCTLSEGINGLWDFADAMRAGEPATPTQNKTRRG